MASMNSVNLIGNLCADSESRETKGGTVVKLRLAVSKNWKNKAGEWQSKGVFVDVTWWPSYEVPTLRKGDQVLVEGELEMDEWEKDGKKMSKLTVKANKVQTLASKVVSEEVAEESSTFAPVSPSGDDIPF